jgi:hypothetical protein
MVYKVIVETTLKHSLKYQLYNTFFFKKKSKPCKLACISLSKKKEIVFGLLVLSQGSLPRDIIAGLVYFLIKLSNRLKSFKSL